MANGAEQVSAEYSGVELVGTTGTFYKDPKDPRFDLALDTAENYRNAGVPLVAVDASPEANGPWVTNALRYRGVEVIRANPGGIAAQAQQGVGFAVAQGAEKIVRHEPEKTLMVSFAAEIIRALDRADVLVIGRTPAAESKSAARAEAD